VKYLAYQLMSNKIKNKIFPELRFPEFKDSEGWNVIPLGIAIKSESSTLAQNNLQLVEKGFPVYGASGFIGFTSSFIQDEDYIAIIKDGSGVGKLFLYEKRSSILGTLTYLKSQDNATYHLVYLFYLLQTINLSSFIKGSGIPHIYFSDYSKESVAVPPFNEQQKIAACLSSLDELINAESEKSDAFKAHKKGLMQQLFPAEGETVPGLRFAVFKDSGEWGEETLGGNGIAFFVNEKMPLEKLELDNYVSTENLLPDYEGKTLSSKLPSSGSVTRFERKDILLSNIRPYLKKVWLANIDGGASNDVIVIRADSKIDAQFLSFLLKNDDFINYIMKGAEGVKMPRGDKDLIKLYRIVFPKKEEQQIIANCLSSLDELITAQTEKIGALQLHKKGLMQELFPSMNEKI
jgi:type I restriction enzyme S subunit